MPAEDRCISCGLPRADGNHDTAAACDARWAASAGADQDEGLIPIFRCCPRPFEHHPFEPAGGGDRRGRVPARIVRLSVRRDAVRDTFAQGVTPRQHRRTGARYRELERRLDQAFRLTFPEPVA